MKNKIHLIILSILFVLAFSYEVFSQNKTEELTISVTPVLIKESSFPLSHSRKFRLRLENKTGKTIRFDSKVIRLYLTSIEAINSNRIKTQFSAFAQLRQKKIKNDESIVVEAWLDKLHWYNVMSTTFVHSEVPNLLEKMSSGEFQLVATVDVQPKNQNDYQINRIESNSIKVLIR